MSDVGDDRSIGRRRAWMMVPVAVLLSLVLIFWWAIGTGRARTGLERYSQEYKALSTTPGGAHFPHPSTLDADSLFVQLPMRMQAAGGAVLERTTTSEELANLVDQFASAALHSGTPSELERADLPMEPGVPTRAGRMRGFQDPWFVYVLGYRDESGGSSPTPGCNCNHGRMWGTAVDAHAMRVAYWQLRW